MTKIAAPAQTPWSKDFTEPDYIAMKKLYTTIATSAPPAKKTPLVGVVSWILPYNKVSKSARELTKLLGLCKVHINLAVTDNNNKITGVNIINWGMGKIGDIAGDKKVRIFNSVTGVNLVRNKHKFFKRIAESPDPARIPEFYSTLEEAIASVKNGNVVFGRSYTGSCGTDIVTFDENPEKFNSSDFWVVYKKKRSEFRIHLFKIDDEIVVVDRQQKVLRKTHPITGLEIDKSKINFMIRNHKNGFIFQRNDIKIPADIETQAIKAFKISGLDFGAVDVIWNEHESKAYVLEINTAPGLEGSTLETYTKIFRKLLDNGSEVKTA